MNQKSPSFPPDGSDVETVFADPPQRSPNVTIAPIDATFLFVVSPSDIVPTAFNVSESSVSPPADDDFKVVTAAVKAGIKQVIWITPGKNRILQNGIETFPSLNNLVAAIT